MASNYPGPYQLRVFYNVAPGALADMTHVMNVNIDVTNAPAVGTAFANIDVSRRVGVDVDLATVTSELQAVMRPILSLADSLISHAELWKFTAGTFEASYVSTYDISLAGLSGSAGREAGQSIYSWRTAEGGVMKIYVMEAVNVDDAQSAYANLGANEADFVDWFHEDATSYALARDTSHPIVFMNLSPGTHEVLFKKRFRN
jgi:hypothetical protein